MHLGQTVIVKNTDKSNGSTEQPAIVNRVWGDDCVNVMVLPDCGEPYCLTSITRDGSIHFVEIE